MKGFFSNIFGQKGEEEIGQSEHQEKAGEQSNLTPPKDQSIAGESFGLKFTLAEGKSITFSKLPVAIGRSETNDLVIPDDSVSANHALVYFDERLGEICIADRNSLNGVFINDFPTRKNLLLDGSNIRLGQAVIQFQDTGYIHST